MAIVKYGAVFAAVFVLLCNSTLGDEFSANQSQYVCPLCPHVIDIFKTKKYPHDGQCSVCGMNLIELNSLNVDTESVAPKINLHSGSGNFNFVTVKGITISVFYYKPKQYNSDSKILLVIPGSGRGAWEYRDNWLEIAEKYNTLILSPSYSERDYDYNAYNLGGILTSLTFSNFTTAEIAGRINKYFVEDQDLLKGEATKAETWIFKDFDRIFEQAVEATGSSQQRYDIFGHSAGGQILSRMAIFQPKSKANRIIAANAGSYTLPNLAYDFPIGLGKTEFQETSLNQAFFAKLTLLIGAKDNELETRGTLLHTPSLDKQGEGRLSRGKYFFLASKAQAKQLNTEFNWQLHIAEGIGHESAKIAEVAAKLLYETTEHMTKIAD
jgi:hypothetical protein